MPNKSFYVFSKDTRTNRSKSTDTRNRLFEGEDAEERAFKYAWRANLATPTYIRFVVKTLPTTQGKLEEAKV